MVRAVAFAAIVAAKVAASREEWSVAFYRDRAERCVETTLADQHSAFRYRDDGDGDGDGDGMAPLDTRSVVVSVPRIHDVELREHVHTLARTLAGVVAPPTTTTAAAAAAAASSSLREEFNISYVEDSPMSGDYSSDDYARYDWLNAMIRVPRYCRAMLSDFACRWQRTASKLPHTLLAFDRCLRVWFRNLSIYHAARRLPNLQLGRFADLANECLRPLLVDAKKWQARTECWPLVEPLTADAGFVRFATNNAQPTKLHGVMFVVLVLSLFSLTAA